MTTIAHKKFPYDIKGVAFDMDGLIFDSEQVYKQACFMAAKDFSITVTNAFYDKLIGTPVAHGRKLFLQKYGDAFPIDDFQQHWNTTRYKIVKENGMTFKQGFEDLLLFFKSKKLPVGLVTASFLSDVKLNFSDNPLLNLFDFTITHDDPYPSKPAPDKYLAAAEKMSIHANNMLVCEDSNTGMLAAINAKAMAVMIPDLLPPNDSIKADATLIVESLQSLHVLLLEED